MSYYNSVVNAKSELESKELKQQLLEQLKGYSIAYQHILRADTGNSQIDEILYRLK